MTKLTIVTRREYAAKKSSKIVVADSLEMSFVYKNKKKIAGQKIV